VTTDPPKTPKDLSEIGPADHRLPADIIAQPFEEPYDPGKDRETVRGTIALLLLWTLVLAIGVVVLTGLVTAYNCHTKEACTPETVELKSIRSVVELVLTPLIGLVGAVTGFYFGEKSANAKPGG
jgi:hypothetical protein